MKASTIASIVVASLATAVNGQDYNQSAPFNLIVSAPGTSYDGNGFFSCHEGAAIEGLCITNGTFDLSQYQFNTSANAVNNGPPAGILTYELQGGNFNESEGLTLSYNVASNVAVPLFGVGDNYDVVFDDDNKLLLQAYIDDTQNPIGNQTPFNLDRWYVCTTYAGYTYTTLAWVLGNGEPQNPTCVKVDVIRKWV